jgi:hypothetical protein
MGRRSGQFGESSTLAAGPWSKQRGALKLEEVPSEVEAISSYPPAESQETLLLCSAQAWWLLNAVGSPRVHLEIKFHLPEPLHRLTGALSQLFIEGVSELGVINDNLSAEAPTLVLLHKRDVT